MNSSTKNICSCHNSYGQSDIEFLVSSASGHSVDSKRRISLQITIEMKGSKGSDELRPLTNIEQDIKDSLEHHNREVA